jgi:hypothetical protein
MTALTEVFATLQMLPAAAKAQLAVDLIDSLGEDAWTDEDHSALASERDAELDSRVVSPMSYEQFLSGLVRPAVSA